MQNEVNATAITRVAKLARTARKLVVFKASPVFATADVPEKLWPLIDVRFFLLVTFVARTMHFELFSCTCINSADMSHW